MFYAVRLSLALAILLKTWRWSVIHRPQARWILPAMYLHLAQIRSLPWSRLILPTFQQRVAW